MYNYVNNIYVYCLPSPAHIVKHIISFIIQKYITLGSEGASCPFSILTSYCGSVCEHLSFVHYKITKKDRGFSNIFRGSIYKLYLSGWVSVCLFVMVSDCLYPKTSKRLNRSCPNFVSDLR